MAKRRGVCAYCGRHGALSEDHVPPKGLWSKPRPADLVKVPACGPCNEGASVDDEYFKTMMVLKDLAGSHPEAVGIRDSVLRGLVMPRKLAFARKVTGAIRDVEIQTAAGLYVGRRAAFDVDLVRLDRVVARVIRGLYWHHHDRRRLPTDCEVTVWSEHGLRDLDRDAAAELQQVLVRPVLNNPPHTIGRGVLKYRWSAGDRPHLTGWWLEFYGDVRFVGFTNPDPKGGA